jgi:hypothetical protein
MKLVRLLHVVTAAIVAHALTGAVGAQSGPVSSRRVGIVAGAALPAGDFGDLAGPGFSGGLFIDFGRRLGPVRIRTDISYNQFGVQRVDTPIPNT